MSDKKAVILGVANERSIAWAVAKSLHEDGYKLAFSYVSEALEKRVRPLAQSLNAEIIESCDVQSDADMDHFFKVIEEKWGSIDCVVHSVAFANKEDLEGRFVDTSREGFRMALDVSAYSLVAVAKRSESMLEEASKRGGFPSILTMSYYGAEKVIPNYNVMGVAKAALESSVKYLANDLGPKKIRVNAISAGPVKTLAAAGIRNFRDMLSKNEERNPLRENITAEDVGALAKFMTSSAAKHITGSVYHVDSGAHILGA